MVFVESLSRMRVYVENVSRRGQRILGRILGWEAVPCLVQRTQLISIRRLSQDLAVPRRT